MTDRTNAAPAAVPDYALYGESGEPALPGLLHAESIPARSRLHDWNIRPHRHAALLQVLHVRAGGGEAWLDGVAHRLAPPCAIVVPPGRPHGFSFRADVDGVVLTGAAGPLRAALRLPDAVWDALAEPRVMPLDAGTSAVGLLLDAAAEELAAERPWRDETVGATLALALIGLARLAPARPQGPDAPAGRRARGHVLRYRELLERHYREHRPVGHYAARLGLTAAQLNRTCRAVLGRSALQVAHDRLMREAERELVYTGLDVKAIALALGFSDAAYFTRFFSRRAGLSPTAYRTRAALRLAGDARGPAPQRSKNTVSASPCITTSNR